MGNEWYSIEKLYIAWVEFSKGKWHKADVKNFWCDLENQIWKLHCELLTGIYEPGQYKKFVIHDPKRRIIHKANVRDRVLHRALYNYILPIFHKIWLDCSFSCRPKFGQHLSINTVRRAIRITARNYTKESWVLKCDIRNFLILLTMKYCLN